MPTPSVAGVNNAKPTTAETMELIRSNPARSCMGSIRNEMVYEGDEDDELRLVGPVQALALRQKGARQRHRTPP